MPEGNTAPRNNDGVGKTLLVAVTLCLVCSVIVSTAAVTLRPLQEANKSLDKKRNILLAAGLLAEGADVEQAFAQVQPRIVQLSTGAYLKHAEPGLSVAIPPDEDLAKIRSRARHATVYLVLDGERLRSVILPVYGAGLYSTLYGFVALAGDGETVQGVRFYAHGETPGLGGEIDNPRWLAKWSGKQLHDSQRQLRIAVVKGGIDPDSPASRHQVDAISGATLTSRGVSDLMRYWLGRHGFGPYLLQIRSQVPHQGDNYGSRVTPRGQGKAQAAGNGRPFPRAATPHWPLGVAPGGPDEKRPSGVLHSLALATASAARARLPADRFSFGWIRNYHLDGVLGG